MTTIIAPADVTSELILIGLVATFLTVATAWILWYATEQVLPHDVGQLQFFLTFIVVIIPFVMLIYFGLDAIIDDAVATRAGWPTELPWGCRRRFELWQLSISASQCGWGCAGANCRQRGIPRGVATDRGQHRHC